MEDGHVLEEGGFSEDNPASYDQKTAEMARQLQTADGFILYVYTKTAEHENGDTEGVGHPVIGMCPGITPALFLNDGLTTIVDVMKSSYKNSVKEQEEDGETEG